MGIVLSNNILPFFGIVFSLNVCPVYGGETCVYKENGRFVQEYCDYGCCGSDDSQHCCTISTSVLIVASVVGGLVLIALIAAIILCCYKNYKDKQASRVRRLRQQEEMNVPRVPGVEPPKPPTYISAPPAYSEQMPESHFRPATATGNIPYNQRFRGTTPVARGTRQSSVSSTNASGRYQMADVSSYRFVQVPGTVEEEAPPPYTEFARGQTPNHRRRRFIRTPVTESNDEVTVQAEINNNSNDNTDTLSEITQISETPGLPQQSRAHEAGSQVSRTDTSSVINSRALESNSVAIRAQESRAESARENESRAETVARVLRPSGISRIPTRILGAEYRQLSDVSSRGTTVSSRENSTFNARTRTNYTSNVEENLQDLAVI